ncbi:globin-like protein [Auriculariales sp. MPI-PUGE-AT-0066]|nr:globin-like protein [Auriculariales sp. MPI-PUGE-AT-0066]
MALTAQQISIIKSTVPILAEHGNAITALMYSNLLREQPSLNDIFNNVHPKSGKQPKALADALYAYAGHIDDLSALGPAVELIAQKHASMYIRAPQYAIVGRYLIDAMQAVLGDALTKEVRDTWALAYGQLADILITRETALYQNPEQWNDWRPFRVARKEQESAEITSFYLAPDDGQKLPSYLPGQFLSVRILVPELGHLQPRQYSLSDAPTADGSYYRISVRREDGGHVSNVLHGTTKVGDIIEVAHPYGDFFLDTAKSSADAPLVLISAGVGQTCLFAILNAVVNAGQTDRPISWIHCARNKTVRAFAEDVEALKGRHPLLKTVHFLSQPTAAEVQGVDYNHSGRVAVNILDAEADLYLSNPKAQYFICGPDAFMADTWNSLEKLGVGEERIHMEQFGTGGVSRA